MNAKPQRRARLRIPLSTGAALVVLLGALAGCSISLGTTAGPAAAPGQSFKAPAFATVSLPKVPPLPGPIVAPAPPALQGTGILKSSPESGPIGSTFTLTGEGLPPNKPVEIQWSSAQTSYQVDASAENVQFMGRKLDPIFIAIDQARTDAAGKLRVDLKVPQDFGNLHDIYVVADGVQLAKGGFLVNRTATITPTQGPIGTPITIELNGLGWLPYESSTAVLYDNRYLGYISSTTTRGQAFVVIRAAGTPGTHLIEIDPASHAVPFLDVDQSATWYNKQFRLSFNVTRDNGAPKPALDWPMDVPVTNPARTTVVAADAPGVAASLSSQSGPVLSQVALKASGLAPGVPVQLAWATAEGTRATASGWSLKLEPLEKATPAADGSLTTSVQVPDNLGGWHSVQLFQDGVLKVAVPYYVVQSLVGVTPERVRSGDVFKVHVKGVGWTELDNGFAVTYDNNYVGYACGFFSKGDVDLKLVATGGKGTHLIDIYPMIYKGKANDLWNNQTPLLSYARDDPGLPLGYRLPAIRVAITVV